MARRILFFLLFCIAAELMGQQSPQFSQNMHNQLAVNPGYAGTTGMINVAVGNRQQWIGMKGAPSTTVFGVDTEMNILGWTSGLGLQIMNDQIGQINTLNMALVYAKRWEYEFGKLGIGVSLGVVNQVFGYGDLETDPSRGSNKYHNQKGDEKFTDDQGSAFDAGLGAYFESRKFYMGFSIAHLNKPKPKLAQEYVSYLNQTFFITGGYRYKLKNRPIELRPSVFVKTELASIQIDFNINAMVKDKYWGGLTYRIQDAIVLLGGVELNNGLRIGYSYDINITKLKGARDGSHELMLGYSFDLSLEKRKREYKSVRYL